MSLRDPSVTATNLGEKLVHRMLDIGTAARPGLASRGLGCDRPSVRSESQSAEHGQSRSDNAGSSARRLGAGPLRLGGLRVEVSLLLVVSEY